MIVGITGYKRSGKDSVAKILVDSYGYNSRAFAQPMKEALAVIFGWDKRHLYGDKKEEIDWRWGISPRQALQHIGTDWAQFGLMKAFPEFAATTGRTLWVKRFIQQVNRFKSIWGYKVVIPDVRFVHEVEELKKEFDGGFKMIRVIRPDVGGDDPHASEKDINLLPVDHIIYNTGTLDDLEDAVEDVVAEWDE